MEINEITFEQWALLVSIVTHNNTFAAAVIPEGHEHYEAKAKYYAEVVKDVEYLESLGLVRNISKRPGKHIVLNELAEKDTGYKYTPYEATKMAFLLFDANLDQIEKAMKYMYSIN